MKGGVGAVWGETRENERVMRGDDVNEEREVWKTAALFKSPTPNPVPREGGRGGGQSASGCGVK